jgi:hypothetical protein
MPGVYETFLGPRNRLVTMKLLLHTLLMISLPIGTYFFLLHIVFGGDKSMVGWCGAGAIFMCNAVIVSYVVMAWREDDDEEEYEDESGSGEHPPVFLEQERSKAKSTHKRRHVAARE